ncbi:uncharacterized protein LOC105632805 isoform X2 [Jatropha curcas]|uniref:uncharacterized protein LOC105632805 isoform X2 n=1 Tax=Jatropha curcas TaxID=180498 RepID=UPI0009D6B125|nr:uncharacterized protein LOC105632805 isoform X2 [Jatropha curcas]
MTTALLHISIFFSPLNASPDNIYKKTINIQSLSSPRIASFNQNRFKLRASREKWSLFEVGKEQDGILMKDKGWEKKRRVVLVRFNQGFGFNGGGGGGEGGRDDSSTVRLLGNVALAIGLTYLSMTGQIGWVFDAIGWVLDALISLWLLAVLVPIVGLGAFLWWAGRDILQGTCPNCGNDFQIFKSTLNDELQLCPFCSQPFSGKDSSSAVVDIEAEIKDAE